MEKYIKRFDELTTQDLYEIYQARQSVFVVEQNSPYVDADAVDLGSCHIWLKDDSGLLAYLRVADEGVLFDEVGIGRVLSTKRGFGYGKAIMAEGMRYAVREKQAKKIRLKSELYVKGFYEKFGFRQVTEPFMSLDIMYIEMLWEAYSI